MIPSSDTYTDTQLSRALDLMLANCECNSTPGFHSMVDLCEIVEAHLTSAESSLYYQCWTFSSRTFMNATWRERIIILAQVKGIDLMS